jgi:hypothetical protein
MWWGSEMSQESVHISSPNYPNREIQGNSEKEENYIALNLNQSLSLGCLSSIKTFCRGKKKINRYLLHNIYLKSTITSYVGITREGRAIFTTPVSSIRQRCVTQEPSRFTNHRHVSQSHFTFCFKFGNQEQVREIFK